MTSMKQLDELYRNKVLSNAKEENGVITLLGVVLSGDDQETMLSNFGWEEHKDGFIDCTNKTAGIMRAFDKVFDRHTDAEIDAFLENVNISIKGFRSAREYGRNYWRMCFTSDRKGSYTLIQNMPDMPAQCTIYRDGSTLVEHKERTLDKALEHVFENLI